MIIDCLSNTTRYNSIHPRLKRAFEWIYSIDIDLLENKIYKIEHDDLFAIVSESTLKNKMEAKLEIHRKYIDIQIPLSREETMGWRPFHMLRDCIDMYNDKKDFALYNDTPTSYITLQPKDFVVFFPEDAHAPLIGEGKIKKIVIKVLL